MAAEEVKRNFVTRNQRYLHGFRGAWLLLLSAILICVLAQHLIPLLFSDEKRLSILSLSAYAALVLFLIFLYFRIRQLVSTPFFATTSLLGIATATAIGTFIAQNLPYQQFDRRYGSLSSALRFLHIDDIFHSWWFAGLFIMLSISLIGITSHYRFTLKNIGFYLAHLSPLIILLGFWIDFYAGFKGFIGLQTGNQSNTVARFFRNTTAVLDTVDLDFAIRLDSFSTEKFEPDYRIQIWKKNTDRDGGPGTNNEEMSQQSPQLVTTVSLDTNKVHHIFGENISFEIREVYRDLQFTYSHPAYDSTSPVQDPGIILKVKTPVGQQRAILKAFDSALNSIEDPHVDAWVKYYWEIPDSVKKELQPVAAKWREKNWIIIEGRNRKMIRIFGENLSSEKVALAQFYQFSDTRPDEGFVITHIFPDASLLQATPSDKSDQWLNPICRVELQSSSWPDSKDVYLVPKQGNKAGSFMIPDSDHFLAFESIKDRETEFWKSTVTLLDQDGNYLKKGTIKVNDPLYHQGYRLYQKDYDPKNPKYSGIGVSREPGLYVVYAGFYLLVAGVFSMFFLSKSSRNKRIANV